MTTRFLHTALRLAAAVALLAVLPGCENDSSPTEPPAGGPTITASSGNQVALAGLWRSRCFTAPAGSPVASVQETFDISESAIGITIAGFLTDNCAGPTISEDLTVNYTLGAESTATLAGQTVGVTRITGTVQGTGEPFLQVLHIDDSGTHRLYHGELDDPAVDPDGYPTELFAESLERQ